MPVRIENNNSSILDDDFRSKSKSISKFGDLVTAATLPKECIASKMIKISEKQDEFLVSSLKSHPLLLIKEQKIIQPEYTKDDLIPFKPIQRITAMTSRSYNIIFSHGSNSIEFAKIVESFDGSDSDKVIISRKNQKHCSVSYKKIMTSNENVFHGKFDYGIDTFEVNRSQKLSFLSSKTSIYDFDICPRQESIFSYLNGSLNLIDTRISTSCGTDLFKKPNNSTIIKWNPLVPYWIATACSKELKIYDVRYNSSAPVMKIDHANISDICWSPTNPDLLLATSQDRRTNLWSLTRPQDECRLRMSMNRFELGSICPSSQQKHLFYGLDDAGSLIKIDINSDYLKTMAPDLADNLEYKEIQDAVYSSDYTSFKEKLESIAFKEAEAANFDKLKEIVMMTMSIPKSDINNFDSRLVSGLKMDGEMKEFKAILNQSTRTNFKQPFNAEQTEEIQRFIDCLRLKMRVIELINTEDFEALSKLMNLIVNAFVGDFNFLDQSNAVKLMALILKNDRRLAIDMMDKISSSILFGIPEIIQIWLWLTLYPSIFDPKSFELIKVRPSLSKSVVDLEEEISEFDKEVKIEKYLERMRNQFYDSLLSNPHIGGQNHRIVQQIFLNLDGNPLNVRKLIQNELEMSERSIIKMKSEILNGGENILILSAELTKRLLENSLRDSSKVFFQQFFQVTFRLQVLTERTPIYSGIQEFLTAVGFSRLKYLLTAIPFANDDSVVNALNTIAIIGSDDYCSFSEDQMEFLADQIEYLVEKLSDRSLISIQLAPNESKSIRSKKFKEKLKLIQ